MKTSQPVSNLGLAISGMTCGHCVSRVARTLSGVPGLTVMDVQLGTATITASSDDAIRQAVAALGDLGYTATVTAASVPEVARGCCSCCG